MPESADKQDRNNGEGSALIRDKLFWRPIIVSDDPATRSSLMNALRLRIAVPDSGAISEVPKPDVLLRVVKGEDANLCFIDVNSGDRALSLIRALSAVDITVVALHSFPDSELILKCVRSGVHEFLSEPFQGDSVWAVLDELAERRLKTAEVSSGSAYVVLPAKPNFGSTTVATGLAIRAQREYGKSVLLADLDSLYGSIAFQLKIKGAYTFLDAFSTWDRMDRDLWSQLVANYSGVDVLRAPESPGPATWGKPSALDFINFVRKQYSIAFLDCPGLFADWYMQLASESDAVFLVTTNELMAVHAAKRSLELLEGYGVNPTKINLIVNRYHPEIGLEKNAIEAALGRAVFETLPNDYEAVQKAIFDGNPVGSNSRLGKELDRLWMRLSGNNAMPKVRNSWPSMFSLRNVMKDPLSRKRG